MGVTMVYGYVRSWTALQSDLWLLYWQPGSMQGSQPKLEFPSNASSTCQTTHLCGSSSVTISRRRDCAQLPVTDPPRSEGACPAVDPVLGASASPHTEVPSPVIPASRADPTLGGTQATARGERGLLSM